MKRETLEARLQALHAIGRDINSSLEMDTVLQIVMDKLIETTQAERGFILLGDGGSSDANDLQYHVARNFSQQDISEHDVQVSRSVIDRVLKSHESVLSMSALDDPRFKTSGSIVAFNLRSILCVPMEVRSRHVGVIYLDNTVKSGAFTQEDLQFLETFAEMAGVAIDNARMFGELNAKIVELDRLKRYMDGIFDAGPLHSDSHQSSFDEMANLGQEMTLEAGESLWHEGDRGDFVALLLDGTLDVLHGTETDAIVLRRLEKGSVLGEMACLQGQPRSASIRAAVQCRIRRVDLADFRDVIRRRPDLLETLFWQQVERVRTLTNTVGNETTITDRLTGVYTFGFFRDRLRAEVDRARKTGDYISLILFDIDHFGTYNEKNGLQAGQECLTRVAAIVRDSGRRSDIVARYGGQVFVTLMYGSTRDEATRFAESIRSKVATADIPGADGQPLGHLSISAGVAVYPVDASTESKLLEAADSNLHHAKSSGRDKVVSNPRWETTKTLS